MASPNFDLLIRGEARRFYESLSGTEKEEVENILALLQSDPWVDSVTKFVMPAQVVVLTVYDDRRWVVVYRFLNNLVLHIWAIERADAGRRQRRRY